MKYSNCDQHYPLPLANRHTDLLSECQYCDACGQTYKLPMIAAQKSNAPKKAKKLVEQRDRFNQRLTMHLETRNGQIATPQLYLRGLLKNQSLEAWNGKQDEFRDWIAVQMTEYFKNLEVRIYGYSN